MKSMKYCFTHTTNGIVRPFTHLNTVKGDLLTIQMDLILILHYESKELGQNYPSLLHFFYLIFDYNYRFDISKVDWVPKKAQLKYSSLLQIIRMRRKDQRSLPKLLSLINMQIPIQKHTPFTSGSSTPR